MDQYYIVQKLPKSLEKQILKLCFGPPQINWQSENHFYFFIRSLGTFESFEIQDLINQMTSIYFQSFEILLKGLKVHENAKGKGIIGIESEHNLHLVNLNKEIDNALIFFKQKNLMKFSFPINLGYYDGVNVERLHDYLAFSIFKPQTIEINELMLLRTWFSGKRSVFEEVEYFPAAKPMNFD